ncbi:MAG: NOB1 family endonuclease [Nitrososphaerota archaeon]
MGEPRRRAVYVLDSTAILAGLLESGTSRLVTVRDVVDEVRYGGLAPERLATAIESGLVDVKTPSPSYIARVRDAAVRTGDVASLSKADISLIAAALEEAESGYNVTLVTDDYSVQNTAKHLGLQVHGSIHPTIRAPVQWFFRCGGCGMELDTAGETCPRCGSPLIKRVRRRHPVNP